MNISDWTIVGEIYLYKIYYISLLYELNLCFNLLHIERNCLKNNFIYLIVPWKSREETIITSACLHDWSVQVSTLQ